MAIFFGIAAMLMGLLWENPHFQELDAKFILHAVLLAVLSLCLLGYPIFETRAMRMMIITAATVYFYTILQENTREQRL